jgi:hypothetical protein
VCLGGHRGFLDRIYRIYRIGGFFDRITGFAGGTGWGEIFRQDLQDFSGDYRMGEMFR